ncbi:protein-L-isoaspartate O-methyltransferase [Intrasporangium sp. DVR]|uniref:protein-L-isoaspartate O-methyltransferase family protein n=1 Tax=Intrasporangium sp. DVR TaxID=3127867 RepID=UPI00313A4E10
MRLTRDAVLRALDAVAREGFLPAAARTAAGRDAPIPIGHGQTNSQPRTVETMLRLLDVRAGQRVLDVGSGSGWTTALLAHLTGPAGSVRGVELVPELARWGADNLAATNLTWATISPVVDDVLGDPYHGPYDRILVSANARSLPDDLVAQLADGGRMVIPVNSRMVVVERQGAEVRTSQHGSYRFVPLR